RSPSSLLNWMKRMIAVRRGRKSFGRGNLRFLYPKNRKVLCYLREYEDETVLCVCNLSRAAQGVELDLGMFRGRVPVELTGQSTFPPIGELPYFLTMPGYGFYWFLLSKETEAPAWHIEMPNPMEELVPIVLREEGFADLTAGQGRRLLEAEVLPAYLQLRRWYADKDVGLDGCELLRWGELATSRGTWLITLVAVRRADGGMTTYQLPLAMSWGEEHGPSGLTLSRLRRGARVGLLTDAYCSDDFLLALVEAMRTGAVIQGTYGNVAGRATRALEAVELPEMPAIHHLGVEQSNSTAIIGDTLVLKLFRRPAEGVNPEVEIGRFLTDTAHFANTPPLLGWWEMVDAAGGASVMGIMHGFVRNQGDAWEWTLSQLGSFLDEAILLPPEGTSERLSHGRMGDYQAFVATIGRRTAEMHKALLTPTEDPAFKPAPVTRDDLDRWRRRALDQARQAVKAVEGSDLPEAAWLAANAARLFDAIDSRVPDQPFGTVGRIHGDYHLGQLLVSQNDVYVIDYEGEPKRAIEERRAKDSPLRDVAGMLRSFDYAGWAALSRIAAARPEAPAQLEAVIRDWRDRVSRAFLESYITTAEQGAALPVVHPQAKPLLDMFLIEKACYEIAYEASHRPAWLAVPVRGLIAMLTADDA
ncbi:MAG TPA: putative maltokinase, partial [Candidatus Omnitrophota bacterium]|nr:putative maltokinase [Candidatus Omnitrophota bacterium]